MTMTERYNAIIIGGGHNGLACAAYLARAGQRVLVLEAGERLGGAAVTREFAPGFRVSACAHILHMLPRRIMAELDLARHGLALAAGAMPTAALSDSGSPTGFSAAKVSGVSAADAASYAALMARLRRMAAHLRPLMDAPPPRLGTRAWPDTTGLLRLAWQIRSLGRAEMRDLLRIIGMNVYDLAEDHFDSAILRGATAFDAILGSNAGPRAPGTVLTLLYRLAAEHDAMPMAQPTGGMGAVSAAFAAAAAASGAVLRTSARVARVLVENDRAAGVVLEDGSTIAAPLIISNADPRTTFLSLLGAAHLDTGFVRRITHFRDRGLTGKLHLALSAKPAFRGVDDSALRGRLILAGSLDDLENAFNPTKYGEVSDAPPMEIVIPTIADSSLAPAGQHVLSANVQYVPHTLRAGWDSARDAFLDRLIRRLDHLAPGLRQSVIAAELLTPADIEQEFNISGGHWHHGELAFDQFFLVRPVPGATQYQTPLPGLYLCGAGAHPGGGVMGVAGRTAARTALAAARTKQAA
jgi:phytoene dehydrogenase-like protein